MNTQVTSEHFESIIRLAAGVGTPADTEIAAQMKEKTSGERRYVRSLASAVGGYAIEKVFGDTQN
jgi:hypothetical protein